MKAEDLMIDDLISMNGVVRRVTSVHKRESDAGVDLVTTIIPRFTFPDSNLSFLPDYANPIPLTPEILEKNGFEKDPESGEHIWCDDEVTEVVWIGTILTIHGEYAHAEFSTCMFVHQLQHALRLCGITLDIKV